jgi:hypothetical protein
MQFVDLGAQHARAVGVEVLPPVQFALTPYFLVPVAAVSPLFYLCYHRLGGRAAEILAERPLLRSGVAATLVGGLAAGLLNDSGVVAWALATGCALFVTIDLLLEHKQILNASGA